jgi:aspartyl-tRNA(Asn)/glutamyl-tRNA(Gln) amidotransferase subunit C
MSAVMKNTEIDASTVTKVAKLARLALTPAETERLVKDLQSVLAYAQDLQALDLDGVPPTAHAVTLSCPTRNDEPLRDFEPQRIIERAPEHEGTAFKVPKIIE